MDKADNLEIKRLAEGYHPKNKKETVVSIHLEK